MPVDCQAAIGMIQLYFGLTNDMIEALLGRYKRGPRKGKLKGTVYWTRCVHGGWVTGRGLCGRGVTEVELCVPVGWDARHQRPVEDTLLRYTRERGVEYQ
jgi:hypothetical protein